MILIFKCAVTAAGTPGPLLGDGTNTTVTMLYPSTLTTNLDTLAAQRSVINQATRQDYAVARVVVVGTGDNTGLAYILARGATSDTARRMAPYEELTPIGFGDRNDINLGDFDVDAATSGEGVTVYVEIR
jgi:hypothetical protein